MVKMDVKNYVPDDFFNKIFYLKDDSAVGGFMPIGFITSVDTSNQKQIMLGVTSKEYVIPQEENDG